MLNQPTSSPMMKRMFGFLPESPARPAINGIAAVVKFALANSVPRSMPSQQLGVAAKSLTAGGAAVAAGGCNRPLPA